MTRTSQFRLLIAIILIAFAMLCIIPISPASATSTAIEIDKYTTGDDASALTQGGNYYAQTFTASYTYQVSKLRLKLSKTWTGPAGTVYAAICEADSAGLPDLNYPVTGTASLATSSITSTASGAWYDFTLTGVLNTGFLYAAVLFNPSGDNVSVINWRYDSDSSGGAYAGGAYEQSTDGGLVWAETPANDFMFSVWGDYISETKYELFNATDNNCDNVTGLNWASQTFTTGTAPHDIEYITLKMQRFGSPGDLEVFIVPLTTLGAPQWINDANALCSGVINGNLVNSASPAWYFVPMSSEPSTYLSYHPDFSEQYAIVVRAASGTAANYILWSCNDTGGYPDGSGYSSPDSGANWTPLASDFMFEIFGNSTSNIINVSVFTHYIVPGDMLFTIHYECQVPPIYPASDPKLSFYFEVDNTTPFLSSPVAKVGMNQWGYMPACVYLSPDQANSIPWKSACTVWLNPYSAACDSAYYSLVPTDWKGDNKYLLDKWIRDTAKLMNAYYSPDIEIYAEIFSTPTGTVTLPTGLGILTEAGGNFFTTGIPGIEDVRPDLFYMIYHQINPTYGTPVTPAPKSLLTTVGPQFAKLFNDWGAVWNISGTWFAFIVTLALSLSAMGVGMFIAQDVRGGIIGVVPIIVIFFALGTWPLQALAIIILVVAVIFVFGTILKT